MEKSGKERKKDTEAGKDREIMTNTVGTNNLFCWMCHTVTLLRGKIALCRPIPLPGKMTPSEIIWFPTSFPFLLFQKAKTGLYPWPQENLDIVNQNGVSLLGDILSCRYQGCQLWGGGLLWFSDLKGPYYFIKKEYMKLFTPQVL